MVGLENKQAIKYGYGSMLNLRVKLVYGFAMGQIVRQAGVMYHILKKEGTAGTDVNRKIIIDLLSVGYGVFLGNKHTHSTFLEYLS